MPPLPLNVPAETFHAITGLTPVSDHVLAKLDEGYDFVTGWRKHRQDGVMLRKIPSRIANWLIRKITGAAIHDLGCSLKVYRKHLTDDMRLYGEMHRFISVIAGSMGARVGEVVVNHRARRAGKSKYGLKRTVKVEDPGRVFLR